MTTFLLHAGNQSLLPTMAKRVMKSNNVLFTLSNFSFSRHFGRYAKGGFVYNYHEGIASIAAYINKRGYVPYFHDSQFHGQFEALIDRIKKDNIAVVGFPCYTVDLHEIIDCSARIKRLVPDVIIVVGNVHASNYPKDVLKLAPAVDYVIIGEAEIAFADLLDYLRSGKNTSVPDGVAWRNGQEIVIRAPKERPSITDLPLPAYDIFPMKKYIVQPTLAKRYPTYTLMASRGCPFSCAFCDVKSVMGNRVRYRTPKQIVANMRYLEETYNAQGFAFQDSTLTVNHRWVREFCQQYIDAKIGKPWMAYSRVDTINYDLIHEMKKAGCWCLSFGMESGNQKSLDLLNKKTTIEQNYTAGRMVLDAGLVLQASFIFCLPGENERDADNTYRFALDIGAHICRFFLPTPYPKTRLFDLCAADDGQTLSPHESGRYDFLNYGDNLPYVNPRFGAKRMRQLVRRYERNYYLHPKIIIRNLKQMKTIYDWQKYWIAFRSVYGV